MTRWESEDDHIDMRARAAVAELDAMQGSTRHLLELAHMQAESGDVLEALTSYRAATLREPQSVAAHVGAALEALEYSLLAPTPDARRLRIGIALDHASSAMALDPAASRAHSALARVLAERSRIARGGTRGAAMHTILESYAHARRAIDLDAGNADAHDFVAARAVDWWGVGRIARAAARVLLGAGDLDATPLAHAVAHANTAVSLDPRCLRYRLTRARALRLVGNLPGAQREVDLIRATHPVRPSEVAAQRTVAVRAG